MISGSLSRRYAKALLQLGIEGGDYEALGKDLDRLDAVLVDSKDLRDALASPVFPLSQRRAVLSEVLRRLGVGPIVERFVLLVLDHNRFNALSAIAREYRVLVDQQANRVRATITSARPMQPSDLGRIRTALERRTGKQVIVESREDPTLLAGVTVQIGDVIYDGSVRTQLEQVRQKLLAIG